MTAYGVDQLFHFQFRNCRMSNVNSQCMGKMHFDLINAFCLAYCMVIYWILKEHKALYK